jgi:hypothetical protein
MCTGVGSKLALNLTVKKETRAKPLCNKVQACKMPLYNKFICEGKRWINNYNNDITKEQFLMHRQN